MQEGGAFLGKIREDWTGEGEGEPGIKGEGSTKMDILAQRWTKWHESGQFGRDGGTGTEIAVFKVKTFKSDLLKQADYCKAATTPTDRKQRKIV